jgi:hypothetical protein
MKFDNPLEIEAYNRALQLKRRLKQLSKNQLIDIVLRLEAEFLEQQIINKQLIEQKEEKND